MSLVKLVNWKSLCQLSSMKSAIHRGAVVCHRTPSTVHHQTLHKPSPLLTAACSIRCSSSAANDEKKIGESKIVILRRMLAQYGAFGMSVHITLSLASLAVVYLLISWGVDVEGLFKYLGFDLSSLPMPATAGYSVTFVAAYAVHKLILPVRAAVSILTVKYLVRYLRRIGYFKK